MNYNDKLKELINQAEKDGYIFFHGKFEKIKSNKFPVIEIFFINNSICEATGYYDIYKKTVKITDEDFERIITYAKQNNDEAFCCNCTIEESSMNEIIEDIIYKYDQSNFNYLNANIGGSIIVEYRDDYAIYSDYEDECVNFWFTKQDEDDDFPRGYISFYEMTKRDFEKADDVDLHLNKFMRDN